MIKANIMPIFNTDRTILLWLYSFLDLFLCFSIKKVRAAKKNISLMYSIENNDISESQHLFKIYVPNVTKRIFNFTLGQVFFELNKF